MASAACRVTEKRAATADSQWCEAEPRQEGPRWGAAAAAVGDWGILGIGKDKGSQAFTVEKGVTNIERMLVVLD